MKILAYVCYCKSEISNVCKAVEGHCLQAMKIVCHHANGRFDWLLSGLQSFDPSREPISILSGKYKRFTCVHPVAYDRKKSVTYENNSSCKQKLVIILTSYIECHFSIKVFFLFSLPPSPPFIINHPETVNCCNFLFVSTFVGYSLSPGFWQFYFNRGLQRLYTGTCIILQKTINGFLCLLIVFLKSKTYQLILKDVIKLNRNLR